MCIASPLCQGSSKNLNSIARPYGQRAFSPLDPTAGWLSYVTLPIYLFVVNFDALAQASDYRIEKRQVVFLWIQTHTGGHTAVGNDNTRRPRVKDMCGNEIVLTHINRFSYNHFVYHKDPGIDITYRHQSDTFASDGCLIDVDRGSLLSKYNLCCICHMKHIMILFLCIILFFSNMLVFCGLGWLKQMDISLLRYNMLSFVIWFRDLNMSMQQFH